MGIMAQVKGSRLEFVVVKIEEPVKRVHYIMKGRESGRNKDGTKRIIHNMETTEVQEPGGFMVYFPRGHAIRLPSLRHLKHYGLTREPRFVSLDGLNNPNSPVGKLMMAQDAEARDAAYKTLEAHVIALATAKSGPNILSRDGKVAGAQGMEAA